MKFSKYSSAGNDFIIMQRDRSLTDLLKKDDITKLCNRNLGIGGDGLLILDELDDLDSDFRMQYYNSDGAEAEMCGNGARAACLFARDKMNLALRNECSGFRFLTKNGVYEGRFRSECEVELGMSEIRDFGKFDLQDLAKNKRVDYIQVGVPHVVIELAEGEEFDIDLARKVRHDGRFQFGTNVNFVKIESDQNIFVRTFERGVESETLSCGTGVTASGFIMMKWNPGLKQVNVKTRGGDFKVYERDGLIYLLGKTYHLFDGVLSDKFFK